MPAGAALDASGCACSREVPNWYASACRLFHAVLPCCWLYASLEGTSCFSTAQQYGLGQNSLKAPGCQIIAGRSSREDFRTPRRLRLGVSVSSRGELSTDMRLTLSTGCICLPCASRIVSVQVHAAHIPSDSTSISASQSVIFAQWTRRGWQLTCPVSGSSPCGGACIVEGCFSSFPSMSLRYFPAHHMLLRQYLFLAS